MSHVKPTTFFLHWLAVIVLKYLANDSLNYSSGRFFFSCQTVFYGNWLAIGTRPCIYFIAITVHELPLPNIKLTLSNNHAGTSTTFS